MKDLANHHEYITGLHLICPAHNQIVEEYTSECLGYASTVSKVYSLQRGARKNYSPIKIKYRTSSAG
jgi:hypothetical protein